VAPDDFDMERMVPNLQKAIAQHGLKAPPKDVVIPWDDDLADRIFLAAKDFVVETGVYCPDTNRVICFTRDELEEAIHFAPRECWLGEGKDRAAMRPRGPKSARRGPFANPGPLLSAVAFSLVLKGGGRLPNDRGGAW